MREKTVNDIGQLFRIAILQVRAKDLDEARFTLQKAIDSAPNFYTAIATLAELEIQTGNHERAAELITQLKRLAADNPTALMLEGNLATKTGNDKAAVKVYTIAHKSINSADSAIALFKSLLRNNNPEKAIEVLAAWSKAHPRREDVRLMLADINYVAGDRKQALNYYEELVAKDRATGEVYTKLAREYAKRNSRKALSYAEKAYALAPGDDAVLDTYGWLLTQNGQARKGLSLLRDAVSRNSTSSEIFYHLGVTLEKLQEKKQAVEAYETALSFNAKFDGVDQARKNLKRLKN
jgi:Tfp pilus assembly protein PilF